MSLFRDQTGGFLLDCVSHRRTHTHIHTPRAERASQCRSSFGAHAHLRRAEYHTRRTPAPYRVVPCSLPTTTENLLTTIRDFAPTLERRCCLFLSYLVIVVFRISVACIPSRCFGIIVIVRLYS